MKELYKFRQYLTEGKLVKEDVSSRFINKYLSMVTPEDFKDIEDIESYSDRDKAIFKYLEIGPGIMVGDELARDLKDKPGEEIVGYFKDKNYSYMPYSAMDKTFGSETPTGMEFERGQPDKVHLDRTHNMRINKILRSEYPDVIDFMKSDRTGGNAIDVHNAIQDRYSDEAKDGRSREVSYEEYASDFADAMMNRAAGNLNENKMKELYRFRQFLAEGVIKEEVDVNKILSDGGYDIIDDEELLMTVKARLKVYPYNIDAKKLNFLVMKIEDEEGGNIDFSEGNLNENEEKMYTLFTTNVEYDNGKTGYMYQLVDSETEEENEIGFDQLYFVGKGDASDPRVFTGKDFEEFDQGSYREEEVSAEEAMKIYKGLISNENVKMNEGEVPMELLKSIQKYANEDNGMGFQDALKKIKTALYKVNRETQGFSDMEQEEIPMFKGTRDALDDINIEI